MKAYTRTSVFHLQLILIVLDFNIQMYNYFATFTLLDQ